MRALPECIGGDDVDLQRLRESAQAIGDTDDQSAVDRQRAVVVEHEMLESQLTRSGDFDREHYPSRQAQRTTITARSAYCTTCFDTDPSSRRVNFERPRSPTTIRSTSFWSAW